MFGIAAAALGGGLTAALLGWLESKEAFSARKFCSSAVRALLAAVLFALTYQFAGEPSTVDFFYAFLAGAGVDVLGNRVSGKLGNGSFPFKKE